MLDDPFQAAIDTANALMTANARDEWSAEEWMAAAQSLAGWLEQC